MTHDEFMANPYGVPTGSVPRAKHGTYLKSEPMADLNRKAWHCKHGVTPETCADCSELGVEQAPSKTQIGGTHYSKHKIQPWDYVAANDLGYFEGSIIKYITRWRDKGGVEDLKKARHFLDKLIEVSSA